MAGGRTWKILGLLLLAFILNGILEFRGSLEKRKRTNLKTAAAPALAGGDQHSGLSRGSQVTQKISNNAEALNATTGSLQRTSDLAVQSATWGPPSAALTARQGDLTTWSPPNRAPHGETAGQSQADSPDVLPVADKEEVFKVWQAAVASKASRDASYTDTCTWRTVKCNLEAVGPAGYVFYVADVLGNITTEGPHLGTYHDYALASITRMTELTSFPILLLVAATTWQESQELCTQLGRLGPNVFLTVIDDSFYLQPLQQYGVQQKRSKLRHAYGTVQVFNPEYTGMLKKALFIDLDTFALTNLDEVFCATSFSPSERPPRSQQAAGKKSKKQPRKPSGNFNGGVFAFQPSARTFQRFLGEMVSYMKQPGEKQFAMQHLLHTIYPSGYGCLPHLYNCIGIQDGPLPVSSKCAVKDEAEVLRSVKVLHGKLSSDVFKKALPTVHRMWKKAKAQGEALAAKGTA